MRINIAGEDKLPEDVIIHGKIPRPPDRSCKNCVKQPDCNILQYSLTNLGAIDFLPKTGDSLMAYGDMPIPMPCRGTAWESIKKTIVMEDPLVQRLGLSNVGEPIIIRNNETSDFER